MKLRTQLADEAENDSSGLVITSAADAFSRLFDATVVSNGTYTIRLTATNGSGQTFVDRILLVVTSVGIASPVPPNAPTSATTYKPGVTIPIAGNAVGSGFQNFRVEWARGVDPGSGWQSTGVSLTGGGLAPIASGTLATWDTTGITFADFYTIRLVVNGSTTSDVRTLIYLQPDLVAAAGNNADDARNYTPASLVDVITVAATMPDDTLASFSNYGDKIDVARAIYAFCRWFVRGMSAKFPAVGMQLSNDSLSMQTADELHWRSACPSCASAS